MSLSQRVPRPLKRDTDSFRDDRLFIVGCDDTFAPKQYFGFLPLSRVKVHVVPTQDGTSASAHVLQRLIEIEHEEDDERWLVLDTDHCIQGTHLASFTETLAEARKKGIRVALSKPSFKVWLLLHHVEESALGPHAMAETIEEELLFQLGEYNKKNLKREHYPWSAVYDACVRAERLDKTTAGGEIPATNTTRVYQLWKSIVSKALPAQPASGNEEIVGLIGEFLIYFHLPALVIPHLRAPAAKAASDTRMRTHIDLQRIPPMPANRAQQILKPI